MLWLSSCLIRYVDISIYTHTRTFVIYIASLPVCVGACMRACHVRGVFLLLIKLVNQNNRNSMLGSMTCWDTHTHTHTHTHTSMLIYTHTSTRGHTYTNMETCYIYARYIRIHQLDLRPRPNTVCAHIHPSSTKATDFYCTKRKIDWVTITPTETCSRQNIYIETTQTISIHNWDNKTHVNI